MSSKYDYAFGKDYHNDFEKEYERDNEEDYRIRRARIGALFARSR